MGAVSKLVDIPLEALRRVRELHQRIDEGTARIAAELGDRLRCGRGCHACCVDDLAVSRAEAAAIVTAFPEVLASRPATRGGCAMLDPTGACRIYVARPYVCRTQGLPLRWLERGDEAEVVEHRDICLLNDPPAASGESAPLESIDPRSCWTIGRAEQVLAAIETTSGGDGTRVALRDLFAAARMGPNGSAKDEIVTSSKKTS